jgi:hypothetical protein
MADTPAATAGDRLRERIQADLDANGVELDAKEVTLFERAQAVAGSIEKLEAVVEEEGPTTQGNRGTITHPALTEIRHLSALLKSLLAGITLKAAPADAKSKRGCATSRARWDGRGGNVQSLAVERPPTSRKRVLPEAI